MLCLKLLFIVMKSGVIKGSAAILIKAILISGILSLLIGFLGFSCWSRFRTSSLLTGGNIVLSLIVSLVLILFIFNMIGWFLYELHIKFNSLFIVIYSMIFGCVTRFLTTRFLNNVYIVFVEDFN